MAREPSANEGSVVAASIAFSRLGRLCRVGQRAHPCVTELVRYVAVVRLCGPRTDTGTRWLKIVTGEMRMEPTSPVPPAGLVAPTMPYASADPVPLDAHRQPKRKGTP